MERISEGEHAVLEVLWRKAPLSAVDISEQIGSARDWSASTVKTLLARLVAKGAVTHEGEGRRFLYSPRLTQEAFRATESRRLIDRLFDGRAAPLVAHLAQQDQLSEADIAEIEALLRSLKS